MTDFSLLGTWSRMDDQDEVLYTFYADGRMHMSILQIDIDTTYTIDKGILIVKSPEPTEPDSRLTYKVSGDVLTVWQPNQEMFVMKRK